MKENLREDTLSVVSRNRNDSKKGYVIFRVLEQWSKMDRSVRG